MTAAPSQRLFFALWPPPELARELHGIAGRIAVDGGRAMRVETLHLTLEFIGSVAAERLPSIMAAAASLRGEPFTLRFDRLDYVRRKAIVWAVCDTLPAELAALATGLKAALRAHCGLAPEPRFLAHLTLLRKVHQAPNLPPLPPLPWPVADFRLMRSEACAEGVRYVEIGRWPLAG